MNMDQLDQLQGEDPEILEAREKLFEPTRNPYPMPRVTVLLPQKLPMTFWNSKWEDITPSITDSNRVEFELVNLRYDGASFSAWKCLKDGKIYF